METLLLITIIFILMQVAFKSGQKRQKQYDDIMYEYRHRNFLTWEEIQKLPRKILTSEELFEEECKLDFIPTSSYWNNPEMKWKKNEVGHNDLVVFVLQGPTLQTD